MYNLNINENRNQWMNSSLSQTVIVIFLNKKTANFLDMITSSYVMNDQNQYVYNLF